MGLSIRKWLCGMLCLWNATDAVTSRHLPDVVTVVLWVRVPFLPLPVLLNCSIVRLDKKDINTGNSKVGDDLYYSGSIFFLHEYFSYL